MIKDNGSEIGTRYIENLIGYTPPQAVGKILGSGRAMERPLSHHEGKNPIKRYERSDEKQKRINVMEQKEWMNDITQWMDGLNEMMIWMKHINTNTLCVF